MTSFLQRSNVTIRLTPCRSRDKAALLWSRLDSIGVDGALVVRTMDQRNSKEMLDLLRRTGRECRLIASNQTESEQLACRSWFETHPSPGLVVSGNMAIPPKNNIRQTYLMNLPDSLFSALQDIEATGCDSLTSSCEIFASENDRLARLKALESEAREPDAAKHSLLEVIRWVENDGCARQFISSALYGQASCPCGNCGWCLGKRGGFLPQEK